MSVYTRPYKRKLPKRSRTLPIFGKGDDAGRFFHCWNCGFVCDKERDSIGDAVSNAGDDHTDYHNIAPENPYSNDNEGVCLGGPLDHYHVLLETGPDGDPITVRHDLTSDISRGCPLCGSVNWMGEY